MRIFILSLMSLFLSIQQANAASIDQTIEKYFAPFSDGLSSLIFTSISLNGAKLPILILFMLISSFFLTFYFRGINIWGFKHGMKQIFKKKADDNHKGEVSSLGALATALSGTVGLGNIAGVAIAVIIAV